jgi:hypothetical protein
MMIPPTMMLSARAAARLEAFLEGKHYLLSTSMQGQLVALMALVAMLTSAPGPGGVSYETLILIGLAGVVYAMIGTLLRTSTLRGGWPEIRLPELPQPKPKPARTAAEFAGFDPTTPALAEPAASISPIVSPNVGPENRPH